LYVTLEPCHHEGRTPPCTRAVLAAGVRRVVAGTRDPNPRVPGGGAAFLASRGVEVRVGCLEAECRRLVAPFAKQLHTGLPWVLAKAACSLDGRIATRTGDARWITNERARRYGHGLRNAADAILVGRGTVAADDPQLTCRLARGGRDPVRVVLDSTLALSPDRRIFHVASPAPTLVFGAAGRAPDHRREALEAA
ncbi:bifunctional diaminohydroxyphosphoribosylaminopyrimidine deaminase/5-amino-6-(5-phosphoribosylamino)uracil reductase RibD, partial [Dissulfurirhabdus thermomarina]